MTYWPADETSRSIDALADDFAQVPGRELSIGEPVCPAASGAGGRNS